MTILSDPNEGVKPSEFIPSHPEMDFAFLLSST